ncbi:DUF5994 family protein [Streptomyces nogalater]
MTPLAPRTPAGRDPSGRKPGTVLLRLATTQPREGNLDGAWWPRSRAIGAELPDLIHVLTGRFGPITRVGLDATTWDHSPRAWPSTTESFTSAPSRCPGNHRQRSP